MMKLAKKTFYTTNILAIVGIFSVFLFSANSVMETYKNLTKISYSVEKEYNETIDKYKKVTVFILKNDLPENKQFFDSASSASYSLPPIKDFRAGISEDTVSERVVQASTDKNIVEVAECYNNKCLEISVDNRKILSKISKGRSSWYGRVAVVSVKKIELVKLSIVLFLEEYNNFIVSTLLMLFILYLFQALFLFAKVLRLNRAYDSLSSALDENRRELNARSSGYNKLYDSVLFIQSLTNDYFTHYVHQLITRDPYVEEVDLVEILQRIDKFLNYQISKKNLEIALNHENAAKSIRSDNEIVFIVLLNLVFRAIYRSKISSKIDIGITQQDNIIDIEISNIGYDYSQKLNGKIRIYELPELILEKLYKKVGLYVKESSGEEVNIVHIKVDVDFKNGMSKANKDNNIIKLNTNDRKN